VVRFPLTQEELSRAIEEAAINAWKRLISDHPERFYYVALVTTGSGSRPALAACSEEGLDIIASSDPDAIEARRVLRWSLPDSPYYAYADEFFVLVADLFLSRPQIDPSLVDARDAERELRFAAMESALSRMDLNGWFGTGAERLNLIINVEQLPSCSASR